MRVKSVPILVEPTLGLFPPSNYTRILEPSEISSANGKYSRKFSVQGRPQRF